MFAIFKFEMKRAFINRMFLISLILGSIITTLQVFQVAYSYAIDLKLYPNTYPPSIYNTCMGLSLPSVWTSIFFMIFPILAAIPFSDSFLTDRKTGYIKNIYTRGKKSQYLLAKFFTVFLSGGTVVLIPILLNLFLVSLCVPAVIPDVSSGAFPIWGNAIGASIYYTRPYLYLFLYYLLIFITSGIFACSSLLFSFFVRFKYITLLSPFILFIVISYGSMLFSQKSPFDISKWILPSQIIPLNLSAVGLELFIILCLICGIYFTKGYRDDTI